MVPCEGRHGKPDTVDVTPIKESSKQISFIIVDPGYVNCGVAIWNGNDGFRYLENVKIVESQSAWTRVRVAESTNSIFDKLVSQICRPADELVVIMEEQPLKKRAKGTVGSGRMKFTEGAILTAIHASARNFFSGKQLTIKTVSPVTVKATLKAYGLERFEGKEKEKAHDFNKKAMTRFVAENWKLKQKITNHNIADCIGMLTWFILSNGALVKKQYPKWSSLSLQVRGGNDWTLLKPDSSKKRKKTQPVESGSSTSSLLGE